MTAASSDGGQVADRGPQLMILLWVMAGLSTATVLMRMASCKLRGKFGWDDLFMVITLVCFYGWTVCLTFLCLNKGERHYDDLEQLGDAVVSRVTVLNWTAEAFGTIGLATGKVSIAALLLAILGPTNWFWHKLYLWSVGIVLSALVSISCAILGLIQCSPPAALWDSNVSGNCIGAKAIADYGVFTGAFCTFVYATLAVIPSSIFFKLQMTWTEKWQLSIVFAFNILAAICSAIKTSYLPLLATSSDSTWSSFNIFAWNSGELFVVIFCGTLPTLRPIYKWVLRKNPLSTKERTEGSSWSQNSGGARTLSRLSLHRNAPRSDGNDERDSILVLMGEPKGSWNDSSFDHYTGHSVKSTSSMNFH